MKCKSKNKVECGFYENGICTSDIKCPNQTDAKLTNYERIRNMSIEEITEFIETDILDTICKSNRAKWNKCNPNAAGSCKDCIKTWLASEAPNDTEI